MPDDDRKFPPGLPGGNDDEPDPDIPASVIFTELMRKAASSRPPSEPQAPRQIDYPARPARRPPPSHTPLPQAPDPAPEVLQEEAAAAPAPPPARPPTAAQRRESAMEQQKVRRVQRRRQRRRHRTVGTVGGFLRTVLLIVIAGGMMSTIFTWFTDPTFLRPNVISGLQVADATSRATLLPTDLPTPNWLRRIGIVSGHRGPENDPGAVCPDGLTEREINFNVAQRVVRNLRARGYSVDLLDEFDPRLDNYQAAALVSIHANTCTDYGEVVSGFLVAKAAARAEGGPDEVLAECIAEHYGPTTGLERRFTLTVDMTNYHTFREIHPLTPAAIIEMGFMFSDRRILTEEPDLLALAITSGILCFLAPAEMPPLATTAAPDAQPTP